MKTFITLILGAIIYISYKYNYWEFLIALGVAIAFFTIVGFIYWIIYSNKQGLKQIQADTKTLKKLK